MSAPRDLTLYEIIFLKDIADKPVIDFKTRKVLENVQTNDNAFRESSNGNGAIGGGNSHDSEWGYGFWSLNSVRSYLRRIDAEPKTHKTAWVSERDGHYSRRNVRISFADDGTVKTTKEYQPTAEEQADILAEMIDKAIKLPQQVESCLSKFPPEIWEGVPQEPSFPGDKKQELFAYRNERGEVMMWQRLIEKYDIKSGKNKKTFQCMTFYDDGEWRFSEPETGLPLFGLEYLKDFSTVFLHEGAGKAVAMRNVKPVHPWHRHLEPSCHLAWTGGASNPTRTDWEPLKKAIKKGHVKRVTIVADNDDVGRSAVPQIAKMLEVPTYWIQFTDDFKESFDLANEFPPKMFGKIKIQIENTHPNGEKTTVEKEIEQYIGPSFNDCLKPATWMTDEIPPPPTTGRGRPPKPTYRLRKHARGRWLYIPTNGEQGEFDRYVCRDNSDVIVKAATLERYLKQFAHPGSNIVELITRSQTRHIDGLCYRPDHAKQTSDGAAIINVDGRAKLNMYRPTNIQPIKGDPKRWLEFHDPFFPIEAERKHMLRTVATIIARPWVRIEQAELLKSETQGTGKSTYGKILCKLVGAHNSSEPTADIILGDWNDWQVNKTLVVVHEIYAGHSWHAYNRLKQMITEGTMMANVKYLNKYRTDNYGHFLMLSNATMPIMIEDSDRRVFVPLVTEIPWDKKEAAEFYDWLDNGGYGIILDWALHFGDGKAEGEGYLPDACEVPNTVCKQQMIEDSRGKRINYAYQFAAKANEYRRDGKAPVSEDNCLLPAAIVASEVFEEAERRFSADRATAVEMRGALTKGGLKLVREQVGIEGSAIRPFLNLTAVREIEKRFDCAFVAARGEFVSNPPFDLWLGRKSPNISGR
ncbi:MAG TPA: primase-helicase family protein [Methylocella sp.]|jgi:hypothetical protein